MKRQRSRIKEHPSAEAVGSAGGPPYRLCGRFWIEGREGTYLGYGRVMLLERIREHGSIARAAASMEMSYRRAWRLVESMNRQSAEPLVVSATGGAGGGGTRLTAAGEEAFTTFRWLERRMRAVMKELEGELQPKV